MSCILDENEPYWCEADWNCKDCPNWVEDKEVEDKKMTVNEKVVIDNKYYGTITHIEPPNEDTGFSGRFIVYCPVPRREFYFWFSDYGKTVISCK